MTANISNYLPILLLSLSLLSCRTQTKDSKDFDIIKARVVAELMKSEIDDDRVRSILQRLQADGSFNDINYDDLSRTAGFPQRHHTSHLVYLAKAFQKPESEFYQNQQLKAQIITALTFWVDHDFFGDNWHNNQISTPTNLIELMLVIGDELPDDLVQKAQPIIGRANMDASGARPSGDRIVIAGILAKNLLFLGNQREFDKIIQLIEGEVKFSTGERGMQHDYSFHHREDRVNNTTSYGYGKYANAFGEWSYYVADTRYAFSVEKINQLVDYYLDGIYKQMVYGIYTDISVKNRSIANKSDFEPAATLEIERLLLSTDYRKAELEEIIRLRKGEAKPSLSYSKFFWQSEHFVFQRPNFYTTVRMFSTRNKNMEIPYNGPGITTHHRADGTNYLMLKGDEYDNIWPVYDWQKISGTTILQKPKLHGPDQIQLAGLTDFVGAVSDDLYGAVAFDFISPHDQIEAKKAWFFFDEEYVCLGAGIRSKSDLPVATTINQTLMRSEVTVMQRDSIKKLPEGKHQLEQVKWVYQDKIGYILPEPATIHLSNQQEQGSWADLTEEKNAAKETVNMDVFALWFDHGGRPQNASYQYIVVPNITPQALAESSGNNRGIEILANTPDQQAVKNNKLGICQLAFYQAGTLKISEGTTLSMDSQGMAMLHLEADRIKKISVADPSRKLKQLTITVSGTYEVKTDGVKAMPADDQQHTVLTIALPQGVYAGKSVTITL